MQPYYILMRLPGEDRLQFRLGATLKAHAHRLAELENLLDDVALLVDLDRIDRGVLPRVAELRDGALERTVQRLDARSQDVGKAQQHRQRDPLGLEVEREPEQVECAVGMRLVRAHDHAPLL